MENTRKEDYFIERYSRMRIDTGTMDFGRALSAMLIASSVVVCRALKMTIPTSPLAMLIASQGHPNVDNACG
jgi:hypothetical protein